MDSSDVYSTENHADHCRFRMYLFGPLKVEKHGVIISVGWRKAIALLSYLCLADGRLSREALATLFWPEHGHSRAHGNLRNATSSLRKCLGPDVFTTDNYTISLGERRDWYIDAEMFRDQISLAKQDHGDGLPMLLAAISHYKNDFLAGFTLPDSILFDEWQRYHTDSLWTDYVWALQELVRIFAEKSDFARSISFAKLQLDANKFDEEAHRMLMKLYAWSGNRGAALQHYNQWAEIVATELGTKPEAATEELYNKIKREEPPQLLIPTAGDYATRTTKTCKNNLPVQTTSFVERDNELERVREILMQRNVHLLTLTGTGGTGKTRLSIELAARLINDFEGGVYFISLAPVRDAYLVGSTIAHTLGVLETPGKSIIESLKSFLRNKRLLLILDNFEQVITARLLVADLLAGCPYLKIIVTSREVLRLRGEHRYSVPPLSIPQEDTFAPDMKGSIDKIREFPAVRLFLERAKTDMQDFGSTPEDTLAIAEICRHLDGLPLAIELAVSRILILPPRALLQKLERRLSFLTGGALDLPERQQALQRTIDWSYDLLQDTEKALFRRIAVFAGGFTAGTAEVICNINHGELPEFAEVDILDGLGSLVDKSLLEREITEDQIRFRLLETIHEMHSPVCKRAERQKP